MTDWTDHLIVLPIVLPLVAGALMLLIDERHRRLKGVIGLATLLTLLMVALTLLRLTDTPGPDAAPAAVEVYQLGNWPAPFGIVLVVDRLAAIMLVLTSVLALAALMFSLARWHKAGPRFHTLFQLLVMGLNGAFLTGDLFNLFVFFEVLLAASYGLTLHGSGVARVQAGLHYIVVNLSGSMLFLIGVSLIYGVTGTLNMADLALRIPKVAAGDLMLLEVGAAILGTAFLIPAAMWPLCFWLPPAYAAAAPPVAAIFAIMSKVGIYVILRLSLLLFGDDAGTAAHFGGPWLVAGGMLTLVFGTVGVLAARSTSRLAGCSLLISSGTLLVATGLGDPKVISGALFYLLSSTLAISALFLLIELMLRVRDEDLEDLAAPVDPLDPEDEDMEDEDEIGVPVPATIAILGSSFIGCALLLAGLPPFSGFIAKFAMLTAMLDGAGSVSPTIWTIVALLMISGLASLIAMTRAGIRTFWVPSEQPVPRVAVIEVVPVTLLLLACLALTVGAGPVMRYMDATAGALVAPSGYIEGVLGAARVPPFATEPAP